MKASLQNKFKYFLIFLGMLLSGCPDGDVDKFPGNSDTTYVDSKRGVDALVGVIDGEAVDAGTSDLPYKSITFALAQSDVKGTVLVASGLYNIENGEQFPIIVPPDIKLIGESFIVEVSSLIDEFILAGEPINVLSESIAVIDGAGVFNSEYINGDISSAIFLDGGREISRFVIKSENGVALWCEDSSDDSVVKNNIIVESETGIVFVGGTSLSIDGNFILNNRQFGIEIFNNSMPILTNNLIKNNNVGIFVSDNAKPNFGLATGGGGNTIIENVLCDLVHVGVESFSTIGTLWDQDVFDFIVLDNCAGGVEIAIAGAGNIDFQFIPPVDVPIFQNSNLIDSVQPSFGEVIFTQEPSFAWMDANSVISILAVWDVPPAFNVAGLANKTSIVWLWHSGLASSGSGFAQFNDGVSLIDGDLANTMTPKPLIKGRSYYWAIWEWDIEGRRIVSSSHLNYFRVK